MSGKRIFPEALISLRQRLSSLPSRSKERRSIMQETANLYGVSESTLYRALNVHNRPKPLRRSDCGKPRILPADEMEMYCEIHRRHENQDFQQKKPPSSGGFVETVNNPVGTPSIYNAGVLQSSGVTISSTGLVTFSTAPASGNALTWTGSAYYRCVFMEDSLAYNQFMSCLYECNEITFKGAMVNKL